MHADPHFGDLRAINNQSGRFSRAAEMDAVLIERWNAVVAAGDEVWHLRSAARRGADVPTLAPVWSALDAADALERTPANGILISGNGRSVTLFSQ